MDCSSPGAGGAELGLGLGWGGLWQIGEPGTAAAEPGEKGRAPAPVITAEIDGTRRGDVSGAVSPPLPRCVCRAGRGAGTAGHGC